VLAAVALLGFLVAGLLRSNAELTRAMHHLGIDLSPDAPVSAGVTTPVALQPRPTPARPDATDLTDLSGVSPVGDALSIAVGGVRHDTLVAFLTSGCSTCRGMWDVFKQGVPDVPGGARLVAVTRGPEGESPGVLAGLTGPHVPVVMSTEVWTAYDVPYAPYFVYISGPESRVVGEGAATTWDNVRSMVANAIADRTANPLPQADIGARWAKSSADSQREQRIDRELAAAGILPGDPRLTPNAITQPGAPEADDVRP
jgi:hypothetical protein